MAKAPPYHFACEEILREACRDPLSADYGLGDDPVSDEVHIYSLTRARGA